MEDILLAELREKGQISGEATSFCQSQGLKSLNSIINFFLSDENLDELDKISFGIKSNLKDLCKVYLNIESGNKIKLEMPIQHLSIIENMTQRTLNVCYSANFKSLHSILKYQLENFNFLRLRNCGFLSNKELILICVKYNELMLSNSLNSSDLELVNTENEIKSDTYENNISIELTENIDLNTLSKIENMSVRSYNVCNNAYLTSLKLIIEYYLNDGSSKFLKIRNCGIKANLELINICKKYENKIAVFNNGQKQAIDQHSSYSPIEEFLGNLNLWNKNYHIIKHTLDGKSQFPVFTILSLLIDNQYIFYKENHIYIFKNSFNCYLPIYNLTLNDLGKQIGLTKERVRQIREVVLNKLTYSFRFINNLNEKFPCPDYINNSDQPIIIITEEDANQINQTENTNFSPLFITYILSHVYFEKYFWFGDINILFSNNVFNKNCLITHSYLVHRSIKSQVDLDGFFQYFQTLFYEKRCEDQFISYTELIEKFFDGDPEDFQKIIESISLILSNEFTDGVGFSPEGIILYANKKRNLLSFVIEILQNSYKPLHYTEIFQQLIDLGVTVTSEQSIHSLLNTKNEIFGLKGSGIFDLRSKGGLFGTIGDVANQILILRKEPIYLHELENLICDELIISKDSIREILFNYNNENRFERYRNGYVKLKGWKRQ